MMMQTTTEPMQTLATEEGPSSVRRGGGPLGEEPDPTWFGGTGHPFNMPGGGGGGGGSSGGGRGGGGGGGGRDPNDRGSVPKLSGKEPVIFNGDHAKAEAFVLEWTIYTLLNKDTVVMRQAFSKVMLFLTFIKGPNVQEWVGSQVGWLGRHILAEARKTDQHLSDTVMDSFSTAFTDTMSLQRAKVEFQFIKMEGGDLDTYIAKFKRLARIARYDLQDQMVLDRFGSSLTLELYIAIVNGPDKPRNWTEWTCSAQKYQQKYLLICSSLGMRNPKDSNLHKKPQTAEQWKAAWKSQGKKDPDTMDTTPGCTRARKIDADERTELMKAGKCFTCKKQGHLSHNCPQRPPPCPCTNVHANTSQIEEVNSDNKEPAKVRSRKKKHSTSEIMEILREAEDDAKDTIIQEFFMKEDF